MKKNFKKAFTLAEVLITLTVIGIIAAVSMSVILPRIQTKILEQQTQTAKIKFSKAMEQMALNGDIGPYWETTSDFVNNGLSKYLKIAKICDSSSLQDCFGYDEFEVEDDEPVKIADLASGDMFNNADDTQTEIDMSGKTTGIITIDGIRMIIAWNKKCSALAPRLYDWQKNNINLATSCVTAVMDVNGSKKPNKLDKDVSYINKASASGDSPTPVLRVTKTASAVGDTAIVTIDSYGTGDNKIKADTAKLKFTRNERTLYMTANITLSGSTINIEPTASAYAGSDYYLVFETEGGEEYEWSFNLK